MGNTIRWGLACALAVCCSPLAAQEGKEIWEEYGKRVTASATVSALGPNLFGDQVSMSNGALSFSVTDVSLPGNSALPVAFTRTFQVRNSAGPHIYNDFPLEDWEIDLPNISGTFAGDWISGASATPYQRCSVTTPGAAAPPSITFDNTLFQPKDYWQGHTLNLPTGGGELLLLPSGQPRPTTGGPYFWITADQTRLSCLASIKNWSGGGEGFLATAPDGTRYWFDWMGATIEDALRSKQGQLLGRARVALYPTRVEDRFGNYVEYTYSNARNTPVRLTRIRASDGRQLDIAHNTHGAVSSVTTGTRSWQYQYALANPVDHTLTAVIQPDNSRWGISFAGLLSANVDYMKDATADGSWRRCTKQPFVNDPKTFYGSVSHPSGATGEFTVGVTRQGRTNVPVLCDNVTSPNNDETDDVAIFPIYHHALSLTRKRITGPGMDPMEWNYAYSAMHSFYYPGNATAEFPVCTGNIDCSIPVCTSDDCAGASTTQVTDSNGDWIRHTYGTSYRYNEGKLLSVEVGTGDATVLRKTASTYDLSQVDKAYPARWGISPRMNWEGFPSDFHRPQLSQTITQDGATFSSSTSSFDKFARPLSVSRSDPRYSKTDATQYHDNSAKWVLGQVSTSSTNGIVASETGYDATTALPIWNKEFGKLQHTLGYHADGTLATVKDGRNLTTTLSSWYRGVPRSIVHADSTTEFAVVDASGWVTQVTDENGFQTSYTYDAMGRMASIVYPSSDTVAWNTTSQAFAKVVSLEYGIPAGHWRQTVSTGNGRKETYFDALWRPVVTREYDAAHVSATERFTRRAYDARGRAAFVSYPGTTDALTTGTRTTYDALDRVTSVAQDSELGVLTTSTAYLAGFQTKTTNPRGKSTLTTIYQSYDQPGYDLPRGINHPEGAYTEIHRDVFGKPTAVKRRNLGGDIAATRRYVYSPDYHTLCKVIEPETGATVMDFDAAGNLGWSASGLVNLTSATACNLTEAWNSGRRTDRSYDARNRIGGLTFPDGLGNTGYGYTADGLLASITGHNGNDAITTSYVYNKRRLMTREELTFPGIFTWPVLYSYNANGHQSAQSWHGITADYAPNALGQPTKAGVWAGGVSYHPNGAIKQFTYGNGIVHALTQNARQLPDTSRDAYGTTEYLDDGYDYDGNGNVAAISDGLPAARGNRTMSYDGLDRLTATTSPMYGTAGAAYSYDVLDNLRTVKAPDRDHTYLYDANQRLTNVTDTATGATVIGLGYDVQGNLANKSGRTFTFDYGNRLRSASNGGGTYVYDGHGRRVRDVTTASKYSQYTSTGHLALTVDGRAGTVSEYIYLGGSLVAIRERDTTTNVHTVKYQHTDALGSPVAVTDASRQVIERSEYEPYGKRLASSTPAVKDGVGYTGHVEDAATGLTYMQQRYYDPGIGRFLSFDPVTADSNTGGNFNRYWYANNNPYKFKDPDGRLAFLLPLIPLAIQGCAASVGCGLAVVGVAAVGLQQALNRAFNESAEPQADSGPTEDGNTNPYAGPVDEPVVVVDGDGDGNAIPVGQNEQVTSSPDGRFQQVRDANGQPTGTRLDKDGHPSVVLCK